MKGLTQTSEETEKNDEPVAKVIDNLLLVFSLIAFALQSFVEKVRSRLKRIKNFENLLPSFPTLN